jgi:mannonate dehydratase
MKSDLSRRNLIKGIASSALLPPLLNGAPAGAQAAGARPVVPETPEELEAQVPDPTRGVWWLGHGMPQEGPDTPKIAAPVGGRSGGDLTLAIRRVTQLGVTHVLGGAGRIPWTVEQLQPMVDQMKAGGVTLGNMMIAGFPNTIYGRPGRDEEIEKVKQSIEAAGKVGVPVVEYNFYAHRAIEGYFGEIGRGGAGLTGMNYDRMKDLPPLPDEGTHNLDEIWANITYFLKAVIPTAEKANVRLALHPNDPPVPLSRGSQQIMGSVEGWKKLITIVDSPSNGITFDCGVTKEMGHDPVEVCRYFGTRDRINHVHYRNPTIFKPYVDYVEGFIDEGDNNMLAVMQELVRVKYTREVYPEHERALDVDRVAGIRNQYPQGGGYTGMVFDIAYAKAMLQAALILEKKKA